MMPEACDGLGASPLQLAAAAVRATRDAAEWTRLYGRPLVHTYQGRNAIALLCNAAGLGPGDEVLAPAYNCGAEIDPFARAGARVLLYDVDRGLGSDVDRILASITRSTRVLYVTHFFGFPQALDVLAPACSERGVLLVEDCAQALFSAPCGKPIGLDGDAAVLSFVKTLPVPDGGALLAGPRLPAAQRPRGYPPAAKTFRACLPLVKRWLVNSASSSAARRFAASLATRRSHGTTAASDGRRFPPMLPSNRFVEARAGWAMSKVARGILQAASAAEVVQARRRNYAFLLDALAGVPGFEPALPQLPEGVCPMAFPFFSANRSFWFRELEARRILVQGWPGYYPGFDWAAYPGACHLKDELLTLPVHQGLTPAHVDYVAESVRAVARLAPAAGRC